MTKAIRERGAYDFLWDWDYKLLTRITKMVTTDEMDPMLIANIIYAEEGLFIGQKTLKAARHIMRRDKKGKKDGKGD